MANMLKCTINGTELEVKEGTTIIEAMTQNAQRIAHYCWHPGLSVAGVCRLCMVEIEGNPRVQIACNTQVTNGMKINNTSDKVKEAVKWGLDFHLINHPLDCPICDQAGECGLQDQYMEYGKYNPEMAEQKVKKHKAVDLGSQIVLDTERCILCARCVRFTDEVTKTHELGIFNRGDRAEIGTFAGKPLNNNYAVNTVDICPVGALTSKDFRFRQRVWFLKDSQTVCNGCSTGCSVRMYYNKEGAFRVKPAFNEKVNGYWMCDEGRDIYRFINRENRLLDGRISHGEQVEWVFPQMAAKKAGQVLNEAKAKPKSIALVVTGQFTLEEYEALFSTFKNEIGSTRAYHWVNNPEIFDDFDGLLLRGDKNPNTKGLLQTYEKYGMQGSWTELAQGLESGEIETLVVAGPENLEQYPATDNKLKLIAKAKRLIWMGTGRIDALDTHQGEMIQIPIKSFFEKDGTFINHAGLAQQIHKGADFVPQALTLQQAADLLSGRDLGSTAHPSVPRRVKNEFIGYRGVL